MNPFASLNVLPVAFWLNSTKSTFDKASTNRGKSAAYLNIESNYYINATISISSVGNILRVPLKEE